MKDKSYGIVPIKIKNKEIFFLIVQHNSGHWAFPKGHKEKGETDVETAVREFVEETGVKKVKTIDGASFVEHYTFTFKGVLKDKTVKYFIGIVGEDKVKIQKKEIMDYKWAPYEEALELITYPEGRKVLEEAKKYLI